MQPGEITVDGVSRCLRVREREARTLKDLFPPSLAALGPGAAGAAPTAAAADLIDAVLAAGTKSGYTFTYTAGAAVAGVIPTYTINGDQVTPGTTGQRYFFTDQSGVVRADPAAKATVASTPMTMGQNLCSASGDLTALRIHSPIAMPKMTFATNVVISAKHCINGDLSPSDVSFRTGLNGENLAGTGTALFYLGGFDLAADGTLPQDFLAVRLDRAVENIDPMPLRRNPPRGRGLRPLGPPRRPLDDLPFFVQCGCFEFDGLHGWLSTVDRLEDST